MKRTILAALVSTLAATAAHAQTINEFLHDPHPDQPPSSPNGDANGDGTRDGSEDEFVEIVNDSGADLDMSGWMINDAVGLRHTFPAGTIVAQDCVIVVFGGGTPTGSFGGAVVQTASTGFLGLNNGGDTVTLLNAGAIVVDTHTYGGGTNDQSWTLDPDITGAFVGHTAATGAVGVHSPGTLVDGSMFSGCSVVVEPGTPFCFGDTGCPCGNDDASGTAGCNNSSGAGAVLSGSGSTSVSADDLVLTCSNIPSPDANGIFFNGMAMLAPFTPSGADGLACTGGGLRFPGQLDDNSPPNTLTLPLAGSADGIVALAAFGNVPISSGETWNFQCWTRDNNGSPCGGSSNLSNAYSVTFTP